MMHILKYFVITEWDNTEHVLQN